MKLKFKDRMRYYSRACRFLACLIALICSFDVGGQDVKELKVGDTVPDITLSNLVNFKTSSVKLTQFKDKLIILDFWASWCGPCVSAFSKLDSLQREFKNDIQIIPVTYEEQKATASFLSKIEKLTGVKPFSVTKDENLSKLFPHTYLPHYVWIDKNRRVIAITEQTDVNRENIFLAKSGKRIDFRLKDDEQRRVINSTMLKPGVEYINPDKSKETGILPDSAVAIQSVLTRFVDGVSRSGVVYTANSDQYGYVLVRNRSVLGLYRVCLIGSSEVERVLNTTMVVVEIEDTALHNLVTSFGKDGSRLKPGMQTLDWLKRHGYSYQLKVPKELEEKRFEIMLADLNRYFGAVLGIEGVIEEREHPYLALVKVIPGDLSNVPISGDSSNSKLSLSLNNVPIKELVDKLIFPLQSYPPIYDETKYGKNITIHLTGKLSDLNEVNKELSKYGLQLVEKKRPMLVGVVREKKDKLK